MDALCRDIQYLNNSTCQEIYIAHLIPDLFVGAVIQQKPHTICMTMLRRDHQRRVSALRVLHAKQINADMHT